MTMVIAVSMITETAETAETALQERLPIPIVIMTTRVRKTITKRMKILKIRHEDSENISKEEHDVKTRRF